MALATILDEIEMDFLILKDFSLKTIDSSTYHMTTIILQYRIDYKINPMLYTAV